MKGVLALALAILAAPLGAEVDVRAVGGRIDVRASAAPLADVLARLSQQTGMNVIYDGPPPRQLVSATLERRTPAEAVLGILEGLGLNYAVALDSTGTRVQTLMMAGGGATGAGGAPSPIPQPVPAPQFAPPAQPPFQGQPGQPPPEAENTDEEQLLTEEGAAEEAQQAAEEAERLAGANPGEPQEDGAPPAQKGQPARAGAPEPEPPPHGGGAPGLPQVPGFPGSIFSPQPLFPGSAPAAEAPVKGEHAPKEPTEEPDEEPEQP